MNRLLSPPIPVAITAAVTPHVGASMFSDGHIQTTYTIKYKLFYTWHYSFISFYITLMKLHVEVMLSVVFISRL